MAHLNVYSLRSKFELFIKKQKEMLNFLLISETKIDESLPDSHFKIDGFHNVYQVDRNEKGSGITMLFREDLPVKVLSADKGNESSYVEVILKKTKWLINYSYNLTENDTSSQLESLCQNVDLYTLKFKNVLVIGDLNISMEGVNMNFFC